jgi:hypothetical protein
MLIAASHVAISHCWFARKMHVPPANSGHQSQFQPRRDQGTGRCSQAAQFRGWPGNHLHDPCRRTFRNRKPGRCRQRGDASAPADRERQQRVCLRDRLLQRSRPACLPGGNRPAGVRHRRMRRVDRADAVRNLWRHRHRAALDPPAYQISAPDGLDGPARRRAAAQYERRRDSHWRK